MLIHRKKKKKKEEQPEKRPAIFVPAPHAESSEEIPSNEDLEKNEIYTEPPKETFIPPAPIEVIPDERILENIEEKEDDSFTNLLSSFDKEIQTSKNEEGSTQKIAQPKEKKRGGLGGLFPLFSSDKTEKELKDRLKKEDIKSRPTPMLPDEDAINIPPYMERQQNLEEKKDVDDIPTFLLKDL